MLAGVNGNLTPTSYLVLGLVRMNGPSTPYDLKQAVARSIGHFWSFPHSQLYTEPARLAGLGLLREEREESGRRRRRFHLTDQGASALSGWMREPTPGNTEAHDLGLLKLFLGVMDSAEQVRAMAERQADDHQAQLAEYEAADAELAADPDVAACRAALHLGMRYERLAVEFWRDVAANPPGPVPAAETPEPTSA
jgi:DNA-binding PadR family transcriptional regulator